MLSDYDRTHVKEILAGEGDWFHAILIRCLYVLLKKADTHNSARLWYAFPEECKLIQDYYDGKE
jgi:hypothetical protein